MKLYKILLNNYYQIYQAVFLIREPNNPPIPAIIHDETKLTYSFERIFLPEICYICNISSPLGCLFIIFFVFVLYQVDYKVAPKNESNKDPNNPIKAPKIIHKIRSNPKNNIY